MPIGRKLRALFGDPALAITVIALTCYGIAMVYSAGKIDVPKPGVAHAWRMQLLWLFISMIAMFVVMRVEVRWIEWMAAPLYGLGLLTLMATLVIGTGAGTAAGTKSWLRFGGFMVQPSQFANLATILMLGKTMGGWRERPNSLWDLWKPLLILAIPMMLVLAQPDLGTAMVFTGVMIATLYWAGTPLPIMFMLISPAIALFIAIKPWMFSVYMVGLIGFLYFYRAYTWEGIAVVAGNLFMGTIGKPLWGHLKDYQKNRLLVFLDPNIDPRGAGYNVIQSKVAIGSGGLYGKGFLHGTQKRLAFLPEQHTDFIFAVIGEEMGFLFGTCVVLGAYAIILWRLVKLAERMSDPFAGIVVFGIFGTWFTHIIENIGMTVGIMPITGIPLPFLSYGGSFLLATFLALGIAQRVASEQTRI